jgi:glutathione S-transferase
MASLPETFVLRTSLTSPFGRKVRMAVEVLGLSERVTLLSADPLDENDTLRQQNPLGKMPCLLRGDGSAIYDSGIIIEFLQDVAGTDRLLPEGGDARFKALTRSRLTDGIIDASILVVYDSRFRPGEPPAERWLAHQRGKIVRGLAAFETAPPDPQKTDIVSIGLSCALGYLDWRKQVDWRAAAPGLIDWLRRFSAHEPAFERTRAPNS